MYRVAASEPPSWRSKLHALTLSTRGVASHSSAAALYGLLEPPARHDITVETRARTESVGSAVRSTNLMTRVDLATMDDIPATTPARTLIDIAGVLPVDQFRDVLDLALVTRTVSSSRLRRRAVELWAPRRNGCALVLRELDARTPQFARVRNLWEVRVLRHARDLGLPEPLADYRVNVGGRARYIDFAWPDQRVAVEFDGFLPHSTRRVFDDDRVRQNDLVDDGWRVFRLTSMALERDVHLAFEPIRRALRGDL